MRILLAPDSFKESASTEAIAQAMARGIKRGNPQAECRLMPLSDGGEGLTQALVHATAGTLHNVETVDAIGRPITAQFGFLGNNRASCILHTAVVELASASGLERVSPADRNALSASTFGTGLLIRAAIDAGADRIVLGLGGSATTDGGTGLARALGFRFLDTAGHDIPLGGGSLVDLERIDDSEVPNFVKNVPIVLACDVTNPLTGPEGAAHVFAPQKGANTAQVELLDQGLANLAHAIMQYNGRDIERIPGTGAAGGTGGGMWGGSQDAFLESMAEAGSSVVNALDGQIVYINVMNRLSVDCDCDSNPAEPDMHDIGILASTDPVALDQACVDLVFAVQDGGSLTQRIESRNGIHTLEQAEKIDLGSRSYHLVSLDD